MRESVVSAPNSATHLSQPCHGPQHSYGGVCLTQACLGLSSLEGLQAPCLSTGPQLPGCATLCLGDSFCK